MSSEPSKRARTPRRRKASPHCTCPKVPDIRNFYADDNCFAICTRCNLPAAQVSVSNPRAKVKVFNPRGEITWDRWVASWGWTLVREMKKGWGGEERVKDRGPAR